MFIIAAKSKKTGFLGRHFLEIFFLLLSGFVFYFLLLNFSFLSAQTPSEERQVLEEELKQLESQIDRYEQDITKTQQEKNTLQNKVNILKNKISKLDLQIKENNLMAKDLGLQIKDTEFSIETTTQKISETAGKLGKVLQVIYEQDQKDLTEILLAETKISSFFDNLVALYSLNAKTKVLLSNIKSLRNTLEGQKESLDKEKEDLEKVLKIQLLQKQDLSSTKSSQEKLLVETKGKEAAYQKLLQESKKRAQEIKSRIFELIGIPEAPTFGEALEIAKYVSSLTGVRPALLLAILTQESNIGKNVGQCYLVNTSTGEGIRITTNKKESRAMNPKRDVPPFLTITKNAGRDFLNTPVSCPMSFGWGGAMGPAQFIPSTWKLYENELKSILGRDADPWAISDAFLASGLYLKKAGAVAGNYNSEWKAAMIYFSGSTSSRYRFYGDSVMALAKQYEEDIKTISN